MTTASYPLSSTNFPSSQWRSVFDGQSGIIGADGTTNTCLDLTLSSVSDTATVGLGKFWYRGYVLEVTVAHGLTLAAVTGSAKTYSIGIMFDPAAEATNPLALYSSLKTAISIPSGGSFKPVFEVTRQPSQTLNLATVADLRQYAGPRLSIPSGVLPSDSPLGTVVFDGTTENVRVRNGGLSGAVWVDLDDPPWVPLTLNGTWVAVTGFPAQARRVRNRVELAGVIKSGASAVTQTPITLPTGLRPSTGRFVGAHTAASAAKGYAFEVQVASSGALTIDQNYHDGGALLANANYPISGSFPI